MAKWIRGINSPIVGKLGDVVGSTWRGQPYAKTPSVRKKTGSTPAQEAQRTKFKLIIELLKPLKKVVNVTFLTSDPLKTGMNNATAYNLANAIAGEYPELSVDYTKLAVARGNLPFAEQSTVAANGSMLTFTWQPNLATGSAQANDQVVLVAYCPMLKQCRESFGPATRDAGTATFNVAAFNGQEVHTYIAFISEDKKLSSDSVYTGKFNIVVN